MTILKDLETSIAKVEYTATQDLKTAWDKLKELERKIVSALFPLASNTETGGDDIKSPDAADTAPEGSVGADASTSQSAAGQTGEVA